MKHQISVTVRHWEGSEDFDVWADTNDPQDYVLAALQKSMEIRTARLNRAVESLRPPTLTTAEQHVQDLTEGK